MWLVGFILPITRFFVELGEPECLVSHVGLGYLFLLVLEFGNVPESMRWSVFKFKSKQVIATDSVRNLWICSESTGSIYMEEGLKPCGEEVVLILSS